MDKGRPESVGFDEIIIISQHKTVLYFFHSVFSPFQIYFVKQVNEYKTNQYTHATIADASKEWRSQSSVQESIELVLYLVGGHIYCQVG